MDLPDGLAVTRRGELEPGPDCVSGEVLMTSLRGAPGEPLKQTLESNINSFLRYTI